MKYTINSHYQVKTVKGILVLLFLLVSAFSYSQDEETSEESDKRPQRAPFESAQFMDQQTVIVPTAKTLEFNIQHRFGLVDNGISDLYGIYAPANIRMGFSYTVIENLALGFGFAKFNKYLDLNLKYAIVKQRRDWSIPVSVTYFGDMAYDPREDANYAKNIHRLSFYNEVSIATRINSKISLQITPSFSHFNAVDSLFSNDMLAVAISGRYKFSPQSSIMVSYIHQFGNHDYFDSPLNTDNSKLRPGFMVGWEIATSAHAFQIFVTSYQGIIPQENNMYNQNNFFDKEFLIGFNITRLWNF